MSLAAPERVDDAALLGWPLPRLDEDCDKESRGRVVIVAGSREMPGAALLAAEAALRAGAGKVLVATSESVAGALALAAPELRVLALPETAQGGLHPRGAAELERHVAQASVLLVGPGLLQEAAAIEFTHALLGRCPQVPAVLDAAAMGVVLAAPAASAPRLVTPHAGEMAHLSGEAKEAVLADPVAAARRAARQWRTVVALKGASTVIATADGQAWLHEGGNLGLATAGSGDTLAGLVAGLAARGAPLVQAAAWGVALHARAGERLARRIGPLGYLARELAREVPALLQQLEFNPAASSSPARAVS